MCLQYAADLVFGQSDPVLLQFPLQDTTAEAAVVKHKFIAYCLAFFCLVFRAAGTVPPHTVVR